MVMKNWEPLLQEKRDYVSTSAGESPDQPVVNLRVGTSVGHGEQTGAVVLVLEVLIGELLTVDGATTGALFRTVRLAKALEGAC